MVAIGLGSPANARRFAEVLDIPLELLYADPSGSCYSALGFRCVLRGLGLQRRGLDLQRRGRHVCLKGLGVEH